MSVLQVVNPNIFEDPQTSLMHHRSCRLTKDIVIHSPSTVVTETGVWYSIPFSSPRPYGKSSILFQHWFIAFRSYRSLSRSSIIHQHRWSQWSMHFDSTSAINNASKHVLQTSNMMYATLLKHLWAWHCSVPLTAWCVSAVSYGYQSAYTNVKTSTTQNYI